MMKNDKEKIKEIILTDYIDGELTEQKRKEIDDIISQDPELQAFLKIATQQTVDPFKNAQELKPSDKVWENIREQIEPNKVDEVEFGLFGFLEGIKQAFTFPQLAFGLASVFLIGMIVNYNIGQTAIKNTQMQLVQQNAKQEIEYIIAMVDQEDELAYDTVIEEYFL